MRIGFSVGLVAAGIGLVAALAAFIQQPAESSRVAVHDGLRVGLKSTVALSAMRSIDPGAITSNLCTGRKGIGAYTDHLGMGWQLMAHTDKAAVSDVQLQRVSRLGTATQSECLGAFRKTVVAHYQGRFPDAGWATVLAATGVQSLRHEVAGTLSDGTRAVLAVQRDEREASACTLDIIFK